MHVERVNRESAIRRISYFRRDDRSHDPPRIRHPRCFDRNALAACCAPPAPNISSVDGPVQNGCPGEALTPAEVFLSGVAACGVELMHVIARDENIPLRHVDVRIHGEIDRGNQKREDVTLFTAARLEIELAGVDAARAKTVVDGFKKRCPLYGTLSVATPSLVVDYRVILNANLRRAVLLFCGSIVVLHGVAIGTAYYVFSIGSKSEHTQHLFIGVWMGMTLAVIAPGLRRMRQFRGRYRPGG